MKAKIIIILISGLTLLICNIAFAGWTTPDTVNSVKQGTQGARGDEPAWSLCVDDSLIIQACWENDTNRLALNVTEISYRAKPLRGSWRNEYNATRKDDVSSNPGHSSLTTFRSSLDYYKTLVCYASQNTPGSEYKHATFNREIPRWDTTNFTYISADGGRHLSGSGGESGGCKTGNIINNGEEKLFAAWPYVDSIGTNAYRRLWYNTYDGTSWGTEQRILASDLAYWGQDACPYPDPNHDIQLVYSYSTDQSTKNVYWITYDFSAGTFNTPTNLSNVTGGIQSTTPYVVCRDKGDGKYSLHFVWQEKNGTTFRVLYTDYDSQTGLRASPIELASSGAFNPTVAVLQDGDVYVAWADRSANPHTIAWKAAVPPYNSGNWTSKSTISPTGSGADSLASPIMVRDNVGNLHMTCSGYCGSTLWDVYYTFYELPPISPQNVAIIDDPDHPEFKWSACEEPNFYEYEIVRKVQPDTVWRHLAYLTNKEETTYTDTELDRATISNTHVYYRILSIDTEGTSHYRSDSSAMLTFHINISPGGKLTGELLPSEYNLSQNYPNPFNPETKIEYALPDFAHVSFKIYDMLGREVANPVEANQEPGYHQISWNAGDLPSGLYFYRIKAGDFTDTKKMTLMK